MTVELVGREVELETLAGHGLLLAVDDLQWLDASSAATLAFWSGIHFRNADETSVRIAKAISRWRERHYFEPLRRKGD